MSTTFSVKVLIADDEELARHRLEKFVHRFCTELNILVSLELVEDGASAAQYITSWEPDIVLLDVQMPEIDGLNVALNFPVPKFALIFQTAYSEHAIKAFDLSAVDYLLKPFTYDRFAVAFEKAITKRRFGSSVKVTDLAQSLSTQSIYLEHVAVKIGTRVKFVPVEEISYFMSVNHMTQLFVKDADFACDVSLNELEQRLHPQDFLRIHRNAIVRVKEIVHFQAEPQALVKLKNGIELKVSRERKKTLKEVMGF